AGLVLVAGAGVGFALPALGSAGALAPALAAALLTAVTLALPPALRRAALGAGSVLLVAGALAVLRPVTLVAAGPSGWLAEPWTGTSQQARTSVDPFVAWSYSPWVLASVVLLGAGAAVAAEQLWGRRIALPIVAAGVVIATLVAPVALDLPRTAALLGQGLVAAAACLAAARARRPLICAVVGAGGLALSAVTLAAAVSQRTSTIVALLVAFAVLAGVALAAKLPAAGAVAAGLLVPAAGSAGAAVMLANGADATAAAWTLLAAATLAAGAGFVLPARFPLHARGLAVGLTVSCSAAGLTALSHLPGPGLVLGAAGMLVAVCATRRPRNGERQVLIAISALPLLAALRTVAGPVAQAYLSPYGWLAVGWRTAPGTARAAVGPSEAWAGDRWVPAVLVLVVIGGAAAVLALVGRSAAIRCAVPAAAISAGVLPLALDLPWPVALAVLGGIAVALLGAAAAARPAAVVPPEVSGITAAGMAGTVLAWSLAAAPATVIALTAAAGATLLAAVFARNRGLVFAATLASAGLALADGTAGALASGLPLRLAAFATLAVAAGLAGVAALLRRQWAEESVCCEVVAAAGGLLGVAQSASSPATLSVALAVAGLAVGATALRADRRRAALVGTGLLVLSSWVRLVDLGVTAPEAYTVPVAAVTVFLGALRRRQRPAMASWLAYGPGLAAGLLPSLAALVAQPATSVRPLALGAAALVVLLAGAWRRLHAPLVLGAGVLLAVAVHELAPAVAAAISALPRWVPLAIAGLLLVLVGATYEHRRRDLRRLRDALSRLS
ncbi:MAG: hypothetical protein M3042_04775, partial [Actinomycetota bacterium]|nr:hypothetical protein [Actinomycetota bacterium]